MNLVFLLRLFSRWWALAILFVKYHSSLTAIIWEVANIPANFKSFTAAKYRFIQHENYCKLPVIFGGPQ